MSHPFVATRERSKLTTESYIKKYHWIRRCLFTRISHDALALRIPGYDAFIARVKGPIFDSRSSCAQIPPPLLGVLPFTQALEYNLYTKDILLSIREKEKRAPRTQPISYKRNAAYHFARHGRDASHNS
jgi:hypothetical protein